MPSMAKGSQKLKNTPHKRPNATPKQVVHPCTHANPLGWQNAMHCTQKGVGVPWGGVLVRAGYYLGLSKKFQLRIMERDGDAEVGKMRLAR